MPYYANNPNRVIWLNVTPDSDFPIQNIPFCGFLTQDNVITTGTQVGDTTVDLGPLHQLAYFDEITFNR